MTAMPFISASDGNVLCPDPNVSFHLSLKTKLSSILAEDKKKSAVPGPWRTADCNFSKHLNNRGARKPHS